MTDSLRTSKIESFKRILKRVNEEIVILENNDLLSLSAAEVHDLESEHYDDYFKNRTRLREAKQESFYVEMEIMNLKFELR